MQTNRFAFVVMILFSTLTSLSQDSKNWFTSQTTYFNPKRAIDSWTSPYQTPMFTLLGSVTAYSIVNILDNNMPDTLQHMKHIMTALPQQGIRATLPLLKTTAHALFSSQKIQYTLYAATTFGIISTLYYGSELNIMHWLTSSFCQNKTAETDSAQAITHALQQAQAELHKAKKMTYTDKQIAKKHLLKAHEKIKAAMLAEESREEASRHVRRTKK